MNYILGGCQIDATGLENEDSFNLTSKVLSTKLVKEILKKDGKERVWQQWQKQNGEHKSTLFVWFWLCSDNSSVTEFELEACTSLHGMAVKTITYIDNITVTYFIWKLLSFIKYNSKDTQKLMQPGCKVIFCNLNKYLWQQSLHWKIQIHWVSLAGEQVNLSYNTFFRICCIKNEHVNVLVRKCKNLRKVRILKSQSHLQLNEWVDVPGKFLKFYITLLYQLFQIFVLIQAN